MLDLSLIDLLNSGEMWAFTGSGCSADKYPTWDELLDKVIQKCKDEQYISPEDVFKAQQFQKENNLPEAFSLLKQKSSELFINSIICEFFNNDASPTEIIKIISSWPFTSYITTNYDHLLESSLGWVAVGNTADENSKVSGDVNSIVWHPHGGAKLQKEGKNSRLVISSSDYNEIYPMGSPTLSTLEAILRMKRILFIGFGFRDPDLIQTLNRIGRFITPSRPAYAFIANCDRAKADQFWREYKIKVISYKSIHKDHSDLLNVLNAYGAFVLERHLRFNQDVKTPDYDIETVGILTHNRILNKGWEAEDNSSFALIKSLILANLKLNNFQTYEQLLTCLSDKTTQEKVIRETINNLIENGSILKNDTGFLYLSDDENSIVQAGKNEYELIRDQFHSSIEKRAKDICLDPVALPFVRDVTINYLKNLCMNQGLGVAQQLEETGELTNQARAVALLQGAKSELSAANDRDSAFFAIKCLRAVLINPKEEETKYLGLLSQAYFGRHLLGVDPSSIQIQKKNFAATIFIADSNFIIPLLARGSDGNKHAYTLFKKLTNLNCKIFTSELLLTECVEHARWAWSLFEKYGETSSEIIDAARGVRGYKPNAFLTGYLMHSDFGPGESFHKYFNRTLNAKNEMPTEQRVAEHLKDMGVYITPLSEWHNFKEELWAELADIESEIKFRRKHNGTYKHERQVKAEAEVALIVTQVRKRNLSLTGTGASEAFFVSQSRVVDNLSRQANRVCMKPESIFKWILNINGLEKGDTQAIFDQLKWELSKGGVDIMPRERLLQLFHNTIDVSKNKLTDCLNEHREIIRTMYTESPRDAFQDIDPLDIPQVTEQVTNEVLNEMKKRLIKSEEATKKAIFDAKRALRDKNEFELLKAEKKQRQEKAKRKKQSAKSNPKKKKKKR